MDHSEAIAIFQEIQARPYFVSTAIDEPSNNCYYKCIELMQRLGLLGYTVRARTLETYWDDKIIPKNIIALIPSNYEVTHVVTEIYLDSQWCFLDPSFQTNLGKYGFPIGSWDNGFSCFPVAKVMSQEESIAYQNLWSGEEKGRDYFKNCFEFHSALNKWFTSLEDMLETGKPFRN